MIRKAIKIKKVIALMMLAMVFMTNVSLLAGPGLVTTNIYRSYCDVNY
ncbi:MAG: hypothetical protein K0R92_2262 [Lachnospiraceae bacterium]|nr:hypothetical protein [Lachnospiraceae bacterium]